MNIKVKLNDLKTDYLLAIGREKWLVFPFDDELYSELNKTIVSSIPVDINIRYLKPIIPPGKCFDRSLWMFFAMDNSVLVRGSLDYFRIKGDEGINHGWVERDGYVYDPTFMSKINIDYYYKIFKVTDVEKNDYEEYSSISEENKHTLEHVRSNTRESLRQNGIERYNLISTIPFIEDMATNNPKLKRELDKYLEEINYSYNEISDAIREAYGMTMKTI